MDSIRLTATLATALLLSVVSQDVFSQGQPQDPEAESAAIKKVFEDFYQAFSRHDARAVAMTFTEDADFTNMRGVANHGRAEIEEKMKRLFTGNLRAATRTDIVKNIHFYSPEIATADADTTITGTLTADGSVVPPRKGLMIVVVSKANGRWLIREFHEAEF
jgi:uncharacterized protein (TIGR02246 family)